MLSKTIHLTNVYLIGTPSHVETEAGSAISKCLGFISKQNTDQGLNQDLARGDRQLTINMNINKLPNIFECESAV